MKDIEKCLEEKIKALVESGIIKSREDLSEKNIEDLRKVIENVTHCDCKGCK